MTDPLARVRRFLRELRRRNVYRVAVTYVVVAFVGLQAVDLLIPATTLPAWADEFLVALAVFGFPVALVLAWAFEMTPEGVRRTPEVGAAEGEAPAGGAATGPEAREAEAIAGAPGDTHAPPPSDGSQSRLAVKALVGLGVVAAAVAGGWYLTGGGGESPEVTERSVAVLPFQVSGSAAEDWRDGMVTMLSTGLDGAAGLRAVADRTVFAAWGKHGEAGGGASTEGALAVARRVGAEHAVVGSAVALGDELRFSASVHGTRSGDRLGQVEVRGSPDSVTVLADELTREVLRVLLEEGGQGTPPVDLGSVTTRSLPALKAYLAGERHYRAGSFREAIQDYRRAVARDSGFALAYWRLGTSHGWIGAFESADRFVERAYGLRDRLPRRERRLLRAVWLGRGREQGPASVDSLRRLTEAYPDDPAPWYELAEAIIHGVLPRGWPEADEALGRAIALDPGQAQYHIHYLQLAFSLHRDSALAAERAAELPNPEALEPWFPLAMALVFGTPERRRAALARIDTISDPDDLPIGLLRASLFHPADGEVEEVLDRRYLAHRTTSAHLIHNLLRRGRLDEALAALPSAPSDADVACGLADAVSLGYPLPESVLEAYLDPSGLGDAVSRRSLQHHFCAGVYLAERGREGELERLIARIRARAEAPGEGPAGSAVEVLEGYRAWRAGELKRAARLLSRSVVAPRSPVFTSRSLWRGGVHREMGEYRTAEGWYLTAWWHPLAHERLGKLYEQMGEPEKAAAAYRRFVDAWEGADEGLQERVERARERLRELTGAEGATDG